MCGLETWKKKCFVDSSWVSESELALYYCQSQSYSERKGLSDPCLSHLTCTLCFLSLVFRASERVPSPSPDLFGFLISPHWNQHPCCYYCFLSDFAVSSNLSLCFTLTGSTSSRNLYSAVRITLTRSTAAVMMYISSGKSMPRRESAVLRLE